jgi:hypothetical protein
MKKIFFISFAVIFLTGFATGVVAQQELNNTAKLNSSAILKNNSFYSQSNSKKSSGALYLNEVPSKAIRHFIQFYKNAGDAKWIKLTDGTDGFAACFVEDRIQTWVLYDKKGFYNFLFREYFEDKLPQNIRHRVKSIYYDFDIASVKEINMNDNTVYIITIENNACWKKILLSENEISVMEDISKKWTITQNN